MTTWIRVRRGSRRRACRAGARRRRCSLALVPGPASGATRFTLDVSDRGDFVAQTNFVQCVGASMQMMLNMIEPGRDRTARDPAAGSRSWPGRGADRGPTAGSARVPASAAGRPASTSWAPGRTGWSATTTIERGDAHRRQGHRGHRHAGRAARLARPARLGDERLRRHRRSARHERLPGHRGHRPRPALPARERGLGPSPSPGEAITVVDAGPPVRAAPDEQPVRRHLPSTLGGQVRPGAALRDRPETCGRRLARAGSPARRRLQRAIRRGARRTVSASRATASGVVGSSAAMRWPVPSSAYAARPAAISAVVAGQRALRRRLRRSAGGSIRSG